MRIGEPAETKRAIFRGGITLGLLLLGFAALTYVVVDGRTQAFDARALEALRRAGDLAQPVGPAWLGLAALDLTSLGSGFVLGLIVALVAGFLAIERMRRTAVFITFASVSGWVLNAGLKELVQRPRPSVVPHLGEVMTLSFPSGHAMISATVYLTLGLLLTRIATRRATKVYCLAVAATLTTIVGVSRMYLGVHYPTDVLGGWIAGLSWAIFCWMIERAIERRSGLRDEQRQAMAS
jgi:undecaprenyl-diphosphatase